MPPDVRAALRDGGFYGANATVVDMSYLHITFQGQSFDVGQPCPSDLGECVPIVVSIEQAYPCDG